MAHFALVDNGVVRQVIVVSNDDAPDETTGKAFIAAIGLAGEWVKCSYNNNPVEGKSRGKYPGIGDLWDGTTFTTPGATDA
jgi:hypothetical protein